MVQYSDIIQHGNNVSTIKKKLADPAEARRLYEVSHIKNKKVYKNLQGVDLQLQRVTVTWSQIEWRSKVMNINEAKVMNINEVNERSWGQEWLDEKHISHMAL